ncbi:MAG: EamA family transporter [Candidatus Omnitrophota bacterium]
MYSSIFFLLGLIALADVFDTTRELCLKSAINSLDGYSPNTIKKVLQFVWTLVRLPKVWISFLCSVLSLFLYLFVLSKADLSVAFALDSMHYIFIAFAAKWVLKEKFGVMRWMGTICVAIGITLVSFSH